MSTEDSLYTRGTLVMVPDFLNSASGAHASLNCLEFLGSVHFSTAAVDAHLRNELPCKGLNLDRR